MHRRSGKERGKQTQKEAKMDFDNDMKKHMGNQSTSARSEKTP